MDMRLLHLTTQPGRHLVLVVVWWKVQWLMDLVFYYNHQGLEYSLDS